MDNINLTKLLQQQDLYHTLTEYINAVEFLSTTKIEGKISSPFLYLIRHSIEIGLKSSILYLCEKSDINSMCSEKKLEGHELPRLYNCFNQHWQNISTKHNLKSQSKELEVIVKDTSKFYKELKELIDFYDEFDKSSTLFRYGNKDIIEIKSNYSFFIDDYNGTVKTINVDKLIEKYKNSMLVFKYLEDALFDYFDYIKEENNE